MFKQKKILKNFKQRINFLQDVSLNIIASFMMTGVLQIIVYPFLGSHMSADSYGLFLTLIGIVNIISVTLGTSLNNVRLLRDMAYKENKTTGDFNLINLGTIILITIITPLCILPFSQESLFSLILIIGITILGSCRSYYSVGYRLVLNYTNYFKQCFVYCLGALMGLFFTAYTGVWQWAFLSAEVFSCIYILLTCRNLFKEPFRPTKLMMGTLNEYGFLISASLIGNVLTYLDRLLLYPILGAENVSVYYTATLFGKVLGIVMGPVAGVLLSYYAQKKSLSLKQFWVQCSISLSCCFGFFLITLLLAKPITGLLYPTLIDQAVCYIPIANLSAIILVAAGVIQPAVLKFCKTSYQPIVQIIHLIVYIGLGITMVQKFGLFGFCIAVLIANSIKVVMLLIIGHFSLRNNNEYKN